MNFTNGTSAVSPHHQSPPRVDEVISEALSWVDPQEAQPGRCNGQRLPRLLPSAQILKGTLADVIGSCSAKQLFSIEFYAEKSFSFPLLSPRECLEDVSS